jgi:APA family basic amino acid/polyamine antiporter
MAIAIGYTIGAGIMSLTGIAIGMTGRSVPLSFLISSLLFLIMVVPLVLINGTVRLRGGTYTQMALLAGKRLAGISVFMGFFINIAIALYALSFADYFLALVPGVNRQLIAIICLTIFFVINLVGVEGAAKMEAVMVLVMLAAIIVYIVFGLFKVQPGVVSGSDFMPGGVTGMFGAAALLTFATGGSQILTSLGAEAKNPVKDIPIAMITSTLLVAVLYALMGVVASGVLPLAKVANQPLNLVAKEIMPMPLYVFFIIGGAMLALTTTLNATFSAGTKPILQACDDGWFPKWLGAVNKKFKTPHVLLTIFFLFGLFVILTGLNMEAIANYFVILNLVINVVICAVTVRLPKVLPEMWAKSKFKVSAGWLWVISILSALICVVQVALLASRLQTRDLLIILGIIIVSIVYTILRDRSGKVQMQVSHEES